LSVDEKKLKSAGPEGLLIVKVAEALPVDGNGFVPAALPGM